MMIKNKKGIVHPIIILLVIIIVIFGINYYLNLKKTITIKDDDFDKKNLEILRGNVVIFKNNDNFNQEIVVGDDIHTILTYSKIKIRFKERGTYVYYLKSNPNNYGNIIVK